MTTENHEVIYTLDKNYCLVDLNGNWDLFALENGNSNLNKQAVLGLPIWHFISGDETKRIHEVLLTRVKSEGKLQKLPFRCDSPECKRFMEMDITLKGNGYIEYCCKLIKTEPRQATNSVNTDDASNTPFLRMCSWCNKFEVGPNEWLEIEDAVSRLDLLSAEALPHLSHSMCDACMEMLESADAVNKASA